MTNDRHYPPLSPYSTGLAGRCPRCGEGKLFKGFITIADKCEVCGQDFKFADSGDGPAIFVMLIVGFIVVENVHKRLETWSPAESSQSRAEVILAAMQEVGPSIFFALLVITVSFLPIFTLEDQEGRLFKPLAFTKTFA